MEVRELRIPVEARHVETVRAVLRRPEAPRESAVLLAHGAGFHLDSPWMAAVAEGLARRDFTVLAFNYPYREHALEVGKNRPPDRAPVLEAAHERALEALREAAPGQRLLLAGKSLGGRMSTHLAAKDVPCAGLVLFGYPLHPPRKPERLRDEHFAAIVQPALFLQGTRDTLCDLDLLGTSLRRWGGTATVDVIDDADHGFHVRRSSGTSDEEVLERLLDRVARWDDETFPV